MVNKDNIELNGFLLEELLKLKELWYFIDNSLFKIHYFLSQM